MLVPTSTQYPRYDLSKVRGIVEGVDDDALQTPEVAGGSWLGAYPDDTQMPSPEPSGDERSPTSWIRWAIVYEGQPESTFDPNGTVVRRGQVGLALRVERGSGAEVVEAIFEVYRNAFKAASDSDEMAFFPEGLTRSAGIQDWVAVYVLSIPFIGV